MLTKALELATQITHPVTAAVFAAVLALIALVALSRRKGRPPMIAWMLSAIIFLLGLSPLIASTWLDSRGLYRIRIQVLTPDKQLVKEAEVTSSAGGELTKTADGWELTLPPQDKPSDGTVTFRASQPSAFLAGSATLKLDRNYFPQVTLQLAPLPSSRLRGIIVDPHGQPVANARVWILGYDEAVTTSSTGSFDLPAHAADGQQVTVFAQKGSETAQVTAFAGRTAEILLRASH